MRTPKFLTGLALATTFCGTSCRMIFETPRAVVKRAYGVHVPYGYKCITQEQLTPISVVQMRYIPLDETNTYVTYSETYDDVNGDKNLDQNELLSADLVVQKDGDRVAYHQTKQDMALAIRNNVKYGDMNSNFAPTTQDNLRGLAEMSATKEGAEKMIRQHKMTHVIE